MENIAFNPGSSRNSSAQTKTLQRTIDYDPLRDGHLKRYFRSPLVQEHMRHAAALDKISSRRNPWNDAVEYLMEAGSAYNVRGLFQHHQNNVDSDTKSVMKNNRAASAASGGTKSSRQNFRAPQPPSTANSNSHSSRSSRHGNSQQQQFSQGPAPTNSLAATQEHYRNVKGRAMHGEGSHRGSGLSRSLKNDNNNNSNNNGKRSNNNNSPPPPPPLPRYRAALRNIRNFDEEVSRILAEGSRAEEEKREKDRWKRTQQRLKVERMIQNANSPKFGRRRIADDEEDIKRTNKNNNGGVDNDDEDGENEGFYYETENDPYRSKRHHSRPRSLAARKNSSDYHYDDDDNRYDSTRGRSSSLSNPNVIQQDQIPGWVSFAVSRFQANCIGWVVRNKLQRARDAAIKIQRNFREHLANRGVNLAVRILQKIGRGMKVRRRIFLLGERHRLWTEVIADHQEITHACLRLHTAGAVAAKWPVVEAYEREQIIEEYEQSVEDHHFEITSNELKRRAQLTCVKPQGKLRRESFRRLMDDDDDENNTAKEEISVAKMQPMETPGVLVHVLQEIEEDEPELRGDTNNDPREPLPTLKKRSSSSPSPSRSRSQSPNNNNTNTNNNNNNENSTTHAMMNETMVPVASSTDAENLRNQDEDLKGQEVAVLAEEDEAGEPSRAVDTSIMPVNNDDVEEL